MALDIDGDTTHSLGWIDPVVKKLMPEHRRLCLSDADQALGAEANRRGSLPPLPLPPRLKQANGIPEFEDHI